MTIVKNFIPNDVDSWAESSYDLVKIYASMKQTYVFETYNVDQFIHRFTADNNEWNAVKGANNGYVVCTRKQN